MSEKNLFEAKKISLIFFLSFFSPAAADVPFAEHKKKYQIYFILFSY